MKLYFCVVCKKIDLGSRWALTTIPPDATVVASVCPHCAQIAREQKKLNPEGENRWESDLEKSLKCFICGEILSWDRRIMKWKCLNCGFVILL